jgi:hypothetical protein
MHGARLHAAGEHLGAEPVLPYLSPELDGDKMLVGANFASAGVGILNDTGIQFVRNTRDPSPPYPACTGELGALVQLSA